MPNKSKRKGDSEERAIVNLHLSWGLSIERTLESGKRSNSPVRWDLNLHSPIGLLRGECKVRGSGYKVIYDQLGENDFLTIRADKKQRLYVVPERVWKKLMGVA